MTCCNDHEWGDDFSYDLENLFKPHDEYDICNNIESGIGEVMTLFDDNPTIFEERQLCMHVDHEKNILCDSYIVEFEYDPTCNFFPNGRSPGGFWAKPGGLQGAHKTPHRHQGEAAVGRLVASLTLHF